MATLQSYVNLLPNVFAHRYSTSGHFLQWGNELLEELQEREFLTTTVKEVGQIVEDDVWLTKPTDFLGLIDVHSPEDVNRKYQVENVENKYRLKDLDFSPDDSGWEVATLFSNYAVGSIRITEGDILDKTADELKGYLFLITGGTMAGTGIVISGNDATVTAGTGYTVVNFLHDLSAALDGAKITEAKLVPPNQYVVIKYNSLITEVSSLSEEFPVPDYCEKRLVGAWLRWKCEEQAMAISKETLKWEALVKELLYSVQASRTPKPITPVKGRPLAGLTNYSSNTSKSHPEYSEF